MNISTIVLGLLSGEGLGLAFSAAGGIILPILNLIIDSRIQSFLAYIVRAYKPTKLLFEIPLLSRSFTFLAPLSLFRLFAVWQAFLLFPPMGRYLRGAETDMGLFNTMAVLEIQLMLYFGPKIIVHFIGYLWSIHSAIAMVCICLLDAYTSCPDGLGKRIEAFLFPILIPRIKQLTLLHNRYDLNIRGIFMHVCETLVSRFDRLEIAIGKWGRTERYEYSPLKKPRNIRLLVMKGRWFFSRPSCELVEVPLDEAPPFEAISYTWGLRPPSIPINVDGALILVTSAIDELLWYRRSIFTTHRFWIDAICIDQANMDEKSSQIPMMTEIYG